MTQSIPIRELLNNQHSFVMAPADWYVFFTEIKKPIEEIVTKENSTSQGVYNDINLAATGYIIAVLNTIKTIDKTIKIPYFFRGNGATFLVPSSAVQKLIEVLDTYRSRIFLNLNLTLQVGHLKI